MTDLSIKRFCFRTVKISFHFKNCSNYRLKERLITTFTVQVGMGSFKIVMDLPRTQEEVDDDDDDAEAPSTEHIPEHFKQRLAEINEERRDILEQKKQTVDRMMDGDLGQDLQDALLDNLTLLMQLERRLNDLEIMYFCLIQHEIRHA